MTIKHNPLFDTNTIESIYTERDGVPVRYVCTTTPTSNADTIPADIFYRETPHPEFGNFYFGIYKNPIDSNVYICNADEVENYQFACVLNDEGEYEYSAHRHDYKSFSNGNMIDGGRAYVRYSGDLTYYQLANGEFHEIRIDG